MPIYTAPLQDMRFILNDVFKADAFWQATPELAHIDSETVNQILEGMAKFSQDVLVPLNRTGDEEGAKIENGVVTTPKGFKEAFKAYANDGWVGLGADEEWGGQGMPKMVSVMTDEMIFSANPAFMLYPLLSVGAGMALNSYASQEQKEQYLPKIYSGEWAGTMCLTESHAGTDLGIMKTKAVQNADGSYAITGNKIFITGGDHDLAENIIHLVLAKTPDAPAGSRGISLFIVPKFLLNTDGSVGERNHVGAGSIEHKMGIKASATCVMNFDGAKGFIVGKENEGLAAMFIMMNYERLSMGIQGLGASEVSYQNAAQYATDRLQGRSATGVKSPEKPADSILVHPDVRRMLLKTKAHNEAARCFAMYVAQQLDMTKFSDDTTKAKADERVALLTPVAKAFLTDKSFDGCIDAQMVFGGHGYIREWGMEQFVRDLRIAQIYEGTNGIQAADLIGRKVTKNGGKFVATYLAEIREFAATMQTDWMKAAVLKSADTLEALTTHVVERAQVNASEPNAAAVDYLHAFGLTSYAYMYAMIVEAASKKEGAFYKNKLDLARFFVTRMLPELDARAKIIESGSDVIMGFDEGYFTAFA
ncbi:MAG: acyl-CoA dehydrogenase C-terminal domain-containing protein [Candidatus Saccharibacteria bacterium]|nr:acyl-CoA dehydrogenase C-terminal domain-containing protein [Moraxellaceae bacterium]